MTVCTVSQCVQYKSKQACIRIPCCHYFKAIGVELLEIGDFEQTKMLTFLFIDLKKIKFDFRMVQSQNKVI